MKTIILLIVLAIVGFLLSSTFASLAYSRLSEEKPIATLTFEKLQPQVYTANLKEEDSEPSTYLIYGDQFRIDARFIKLRAWANILGFDARYRLERLEGRYRNIEDQNSKTKPRLAHDLGEDELFRVPDFAIDYNVVLDARYGTSSYIEIDEAQAYTAYRTQFGIIIRHEPLLKDPKREERLIDRITGFFTHKERSLQ